MKLAMLAALVIPAIHLNAQAADMSVPKQQMAAIIVPATSMRWSPAPPILPAGARVAVLQGDPSKPGPFAMRITFPSGYRIPAHFHAADEHVTVIQGTFQIGMGDTFDATKLTELPAGSFLVLPAGMRHFAQTQGETVVQLHGVGPWSLTYVNPADDPRNAKPAQ